MANTAVLTLETVQEGLRFHAKAGSGQETFTESGKGLQHPSPIELLLVALGGCLAMDVIAILRKQRQDVKAYEVAMTGQRREECPRAFTRIELIHRLTGRDLRLRAIEQAIHLSETKYCSVHATLSKDVEIINRIEIVPVEEPV